MTSATLASTAFAQDLPAQIGDLTAAQRSAAVATLKQIRAILLQVPDIREPSGFEVYIDGYGGSKKLGPDQKPIPRGTTEYMLRVFCYFPVRKGHEGSECIRITVNNGNGAPGGNAMRDAQGREVLVESRRGAPVPLAVQTWDGLSEDRNVKSSVRVMFATRGDLPWRQVTREEFYAATILEREGQGGATSSEMQQSLEKTPYQSWMEGAEERKRNREQSIAAAARQSPEYAAQVRKKLEDSERDVTANLKASEQSDRENSKQALREHEQRLGEHSRRARSDDAGGTAPAGVRHGGVSRQRALQHGFQRAGRGPARRSQDQSCSHPELRFLARAPVAGGGPQHHGHHLRRPDRTTASGPSRAARDLQEAGLGGAEPAAGGTAVSHPERQRGISHRNPKSP